MTSNGSAHGPTAETVRRKLAEIRKEKRITYAELSRLLDNVDTPIPPLGLRNIEAGKRKVTVDELMGLAYVLEVSPLWLLMPESTSANDTVEATGVGEVEANDLWKWFTAGADPHSGMLNISNFVRTVPGWHIEHSVSRYTDQHRTPGVL